MPSGHASTALTVAPLPHVADIELGVRNTGVWSLLLICKALALPPAALFEDFGAGVLKRLGR